MQKITIKVNKRIRNSLTCTCMTKNAVAAMKPRCRINGRTKADKNPDFVDDSYSTRRAVGSISFIFCFLSLRLWFSVFKNNDYFKFCMLLQQQWKKDVTYRERECEYMHDMEVQVPKWRWHTTKRFMMTNKYIIKISSPNQHPGHNLWFDHWRYIQNGKTCFKLITWVKIIHD